MFVLKKTHLKTQAELDKAKKDLTKLMSWLFVNYVVSDKGIIIIRCPKTGRYKSIKAPKWLSYE